ncbi:MAG: hypothetical protein AMXMBFR84_06960 [Candidatus Hydrogenedentota bacterium]
MKFVLKALAVLLIVAAISAAAVLFYADSKYHALRAAREASFSEVADESVSMVLVMKPALAEALILEKASALSENIRPWMINFALPYEAALLMRPDLANKRLDTTMFLNERRFGPMIVQQANAYGMGAVMPQVQWAPDGFVQKERGVITVDGSLPINPAIAALAEQKWGIVTPAGYPEPEGGHLAELIVDNRNGGLFLLLGTLQSSGIVSMNLPPDELATNLLPVGIFRLNADLVSPEVANITLRIEAAINATEGEFGAFDFTLSLLYGALAKGLRDNGGIELEGSKKREGTVITGQYTLTGVSKLFEPPQPQGMARPN